MPASRGSISERAEGDRRPTRASAKPWRWNGRLSVRRLRHSEER